MFASIHKNIISQMSTKPFKQTSSTMQVKMIIKCRIFWMVCLHFNMGDQNSPVVDHEE